MLSSLNKVLVVCSRLLITCIRSSSSLNEIVKLDTASTDDAANARPGSEDLESDANAYDCLAEQCEQSHQDV